LATGTDFSKSIASKSLADSVKDALSWVKNGLVPSWLKTNPWKKITVTENINGIDHTLEYWVTPDDIAVGDDTDWFYPAWFPSDAQVVADFYNSIIPSRKMVRDIFKQADTQVLYQDLGSPWKDSKGSPVPSEFAKATSLIEGNRKIKLALGTNSPADHLIAGHSKDIVTGPNLDGKHVVIYGGYQPGGVDGLFLQGYSGDKHSSDYIDHSHKLRLVFRKAYLDGKLVDIENDVFNGPLFKLVDDHGVPFDPRYPNLKSVVSITEGGKTTIVQPKTVISPTDERPMDWKIPAMLATGGVGLAIVFGLLRR